MRLLSNFWGDLKNRNAIVAKGILFLLLGFLSATLLLYYAWDFKVAILLAITVWAFCRFYYFAFYVIEHYVDSSCRFSGLTSFFHYLLSSKPSPKSPSRPSQPSNKEDPCD